jgi:hypothetical protein
MAVKLYCKYIDEDELHEFIFVQNWCKASWEKYMQKRIDLHRIGKTVEPRYVECWVFEIVEGDVNGRERD